jgi:hypothetical protein
MKKTIFTLTTICFLAISASATIRRVNPSPGIAGANVYTTVQLAVTAAVANDTIQIEPYGVSQSTYSENITITKKLVFLGAGYNLTNNQLVSPPARKDWCQLNSITFNNGSANSSVIGLVVNVVYVYAPNITITRCITNVQLGKSTNTISAAFSYGNNASITRCWLTNISGLNSGSPDVTTGAFISNNIIYGAVNNFFNAIIKNNFMFMVSSIGNYHYNVDNSSMTNNIYEGIMHNSTIYPIEDIATCSGNSYGYNLVTSYNLLPVGNGNINGADISSIFTDNNVFNYQTQYLQMEQGIDLAPGSPAIGTGSGGIDMGPLGGTTPYLKSGLPPYPIITSAVNSGLGNATVPLNVNVSVRSNN